MLTFAAVYLMIGGANAYVAVGQRYLSTSEIVFYLLLWPLQLLFLLLVGLYTAADVILGRLFR